MTDCTQCGGTELVEDALGKTIRCPECTWQPDPVAADGRTIEALQAEVARLRAALNDPQGPNLGGKTREPGLMTILIEHYLNETVNTASAADLAARYLDALKGGA